MIRCEKWEARFHGHLQSVAQKPWHWGVHDCVSFAAGSVAMQLGVDRLSLSIGTWSTRIGAAPVLKSASNGSGSMLDALNRLADQKPLENMQRGDVVAYPVDLDLDGTGSIAVGIFDGGGVLVASNVGFLRLPKDRIIAVWPVEGFA